MRHKAYHIPPGSLNATNLHIPSVSYNALVGLRAESSLQKSASIDVTPNMRALRTHQAPDHHLALELDEDARASTMKLKTCMEHMALDSRKRQQFRSVMKRNCIPGSLEVGSELQ
jgi:hypothetical protein